MKENNKYRIIITILTGLLLVISAIVLNVKEATDKKEPIVKKTDAIKFKEEYEALNNKEIKDGLKYEAISILETNSFKYKTEEEIIDIIKNGTGIIYLGYSNCPWCRNAVNVLQHVSANEILYLDMKELRDTYEYKDGDIVKTKEGSQGYYELLKLLDSILDEYTVTDSDGNEYSVGEKRVYVPLVIGVKEGEIVGYHCDLVDLNEGQTPFEVLTIEQQEKLKQIYDNIVNKVFNDTCDITGRQGC